LRIRESEKMSLLDHRLATILQMKAAFAVRMFELYRLRRRVQTAQLAQAAQGECDQDRALGSSGQPQLAASFERNRGFNRLRARICR
jgi:hypothetical protein